MSLDIYQIAEAFSSQRFAAAYPYMADEIKWNIVGREELMGQEAFINRCAASTTIKRLKINRADTCVIVEGAAQFQDQEDQTSSAASWDVVQFSEERLVEITSSIIELNKPWDHSRLSPD